MCDAQGEGGGEGEAPVRVSARSTGLSPAGRDAHKTRITKHIHTLTMKKERLVGVELEKCDEEIKKNNVTLETGITEDQEVREGTRGEAEKMGKGGEPSHRKIV